MGEVPILYCTTPLAFGICLQAAEAPVKMDRIMSTNTTFPSSTTSRRQFLSTSALGAGAALIASNALARTAHASGGDEIKIGLIGCGAAVPARRPRRSARLAR